MYTPFTDKRGNPVFINNLYYRHLCQLEDIDEGYKIEYKETFNQDVKRKIPAIVSSFANSDGGWLFIGIEDKHHSIVPIQQARTDFSQTISQLLKTTVSPIPKFECKFIKKPKCSGEGVLAVYTYPGTFTPYVCNGTIYIRNGSSKEPIKSERATIEFLYRKAEKFREEIDRFCQREVYFPYTKEVFGKRTRDYAICNIYLKNVSGGEKKIIRTMGDFDNLSSHIQNLDSKLFSMLQSSQQSVTVWHRAINPLTNAATLVWEIFRDLSMKIHFPISIDPDYRKNIIQELGQEGFCVNESAHIFDGLLSYNTVDASLNTAISLLKQYEQGIDDYALCMEIEDCENAVLYFKGNAYRSDLRKNGLRFACKPRVKSDIWFLADENMTWEELPWIAAQRLFVSSFGLRLNSFETMHTEAMKIQFPDLVE